MHRCVEMETEWSHTEAMRDKKDLSQGCPEDTWPCHTWITVTVILSVCLASLLWLLSVHIDPPDAANCMHCCQCPAEGIGSPGTNPAWAQPRRRWVSEVCDFPLSPLLKNASGVGDNMGRDSWSPAWLHSENPSFLSCS
jgi:hypothetical protein